MKRVYKTVILLLLACFVLPLAIPVNSVSLQEQSWLHHLRPANLPKPNGKTSFPAELLIDIPNHTQVKLTGTCSLEGQLTDEDILDAIKKAASEAGYKSPENAVADKLKIEELKDKLTFSEEDQQRIIKNWLSMVGMDKVADILKGEFPSYGETDAVSAVVDMIKTGRFPQLSSLSPVPTDFGGFAQNIIINGTTQTIDQYKRDQQKWKDIVELSQARARYREFTSRLNSIIKQKTKEMTAWTIRIQAQTVQEQMYRKEPEIRLPYIYTSDIVLTKKDGDFENPKGVYEGEFKIDIDISLEDYDKNFHKYLAESFNKKIRENVPVTTPEMFYSPKSQSVNRTSENKATLGKTGVYVELGKNSLGGVYELELNAQALDILYQKVLHDFVAVIEKRTEGGTETITWTEITDSETKTSYQQTYNRVVTVAGEVLESTNTDDVPYPDTDVRTYITLTLVVDMSGR